MEFYCSFQHIIYKDAKTGLSMFAVKPDDKEIPINEEYGNLACKGIILDTYPKDMPLIIEGDYINVKFPYLKVREVRPAGKNDAITLSFIKNGGFKGIGEAYSKKIIELTNGDVFNYCKHSNAVYELTNLGLKKEDVISFVNKINEYSQLQDLISLISYYGGDYNSAKDIYEKYGKDSINIINKNPYILQSCEVSYFVVETLAKKAGIKTLNEIRIESLVRESIKNIESRGNTRMTFENLFNACSYLENKANQGYKTDRISILAYVLRNKDKFYIKETRDGYMVYSKKMYRIENKSASHVARLLKTKKNFPIELASIEKIEKERRIKYGNEQKEAFNLLKDSGIKILTGGPGTGKSTVIDGLIRYYKQMFPNNTVALCSPTGAASKKLREITGDDTARTIHKLLDVKPSFNNGYNYRDEYNQLSYDFIIADEFSMTDAELFMMLVSGMKDGALLLIVGDQDQLSSVGSGKVLHDLLNSDHIESVRLKEVYRQAGESSIIANSIKIKEGDSNLISDDNFLICNVNNEDYMLDFTLRMASSFKSFERKNIKIYTPVKNEKYVISTHELNNRIRDLYNKDNYNKKFLIYNSVKFYVDDPVIMNKNNYKMGYLNGDQGKIVDIEIDDKGNSTMYVMLDGYDEEFILSGARLAEVELAYALTIHKSQGSECDTAIILVPEKPKGMLERSLVYVAATRARQKNILVVENNALDVAIATDKRYLRNTGLLEEIQEALSAYNKEN